VVNLAVTAWVVAVLMLATFVCAVTL